jgi:hypothetical protein
MGGMQYWYHCRPAAYVEIIQRRLNKTRNAFEKNVLVALDKIYDSLSDNQRPTIILKPNGTLARIHPITFSIPDEFIRRSTPPKYKPFSRVVPGDKSTYFSLEEEYLYREDLSRSLFALTYRKGGWDCLRHLEIMASGSLPLFLDIANSPARNVALYPKALFAVLLRYPGLSLKAQRESQHKFRLKKLAFTTKGFDQSLYMLIVSVLLRYVRNVLSTTAMAEYFLLTVHREQQLLAATDEKASRAGTNETFADGNRTLTAAGVSSNAMKNTGFTANRSSNSSSSSRAIDRAATRTTTMSASAVNIEFPRRILFLTHDDKDMDKGDYLADTLLHGLKRLMGEDAVRDFPRRNGLYMSPSDFNYTVGYLGRRSKLYGFGYSWASTIDRLDEPIARIPRLKDLRFAKAELLSKSYDLIVLGSGHRDGFAAALHLWDLVCENYPPSKVVFVDGSDKSMNYQLFAKYAQCAGIYFSREGPYYTRIVRDPTSSSY